jgi:hypothetical protein
MASASTDIETFAEYEAEYAGAARDVDKALASGSSAAASTAISASRAAVSSMQVELRSLREPLRKELAVKVAAYSAQLDKWAAAALTAGGGRPAPSADLTARGGAVLDKEKTGAATLAAANRQLEETLGVATGVMGELAEQRDKLGRIQGKAAGVSADMREAQAVLKRMGAKPE